MNKDSEKNLVMIPGYGKQELYLYEVEGTDELFLADFCYQDKEYEGVVDLNANLLVPFSTVKIQDCFADLDRSNYCFTRFNDNGKTCESFHLSRIDGNYQLVEDIKGNEITTCKLIPSGKNSYWFLESTTRDIVEVSLYDVKTHTILTPSFGLISFEREKGRILAYVEKGLYTKKDDEDILLGTLVSFIDHQGNFVTPLYMPMKDLEYDSRSYNFDKSFKSFNRTIQVMIQDLEIENKGISNHINYMFNNPYTIEEMNSVKSNAKILDYTRRNK